MSAGAKLYEVRGKHGTVYAVHDLASNMFWSERTEQAARDLANEKSLTITEQRTITRDDLLKLMGQPPALKTGVSRETSAPQAPKAEKPPALHVGKWPKLSFEPIDTMPHLPPPSDDVVVVQKQADDAIVASRHELPAAQRNVFSRTASTVAPPPADADLLTGRQDVSRHAGPRR